MCVCVCVCVWPGGSGKQYSRLTRRLLAVRSVEEIVADEEDDQRERRVPRRERGVELGLVAQHVHGLQEV